MMHLLWFMLWSTLPPLAHFSNPDRCTVRESSSLQNESPLLKSLQCYNDYKSFVHCEWRENRNSTLQLCFKTGDNSKQCCPSSVPGQNASEHRTVQCRYETPAFAIGIKHTVFFFNKKTETLCTSASHRTLHPSQHLRAHPPVGLSTHAVGDGGWQLSWSSPYPSSSSLNKNIKYQLSYRTHGQDNCTIEDVTNTSIKLEKQLLLPGRRYEARVRAQASVGQWSHWGPVVTWQTAEDAGQSPSLHCVLDGEKEVMCSWEVSRELANSITYQLAYPHNQTVLSERCFVNQISDLSGTVLKYSCSLTVPDPAHLLLELLPIRNAKVFESSQHIRPDPPQKVEVREKGSNWKVNWEKPDKAFRPELYYQLCYYRTQEQGCSIMNISGSTTQTILGASLAPSQKYWVKVRSLVVSEDSSYRGIPSEWSKPVSWISHEATWSVTTLIYISISVVVAAVFLTLYCTIPACQRKVILWVDSVPSPEKSKILTEIKYDYILCNHDVSFLSSLPPAGPSCKVRTRPRASSSVASLWPIEDIEKKRLDQREGCWKCDNQLSLTEEVNSSDTSFVSFTGPYILCQTSGPDHNSVDVKCEEKEKEAPSDDSVLPSTMNFSLYGDGYVCLPSRSVSRSTQDLVSHSDANTSTHTHNIAEQDQHQPDTTPCPDKTDVQPDLSTPTNSHQPPDYTSEHFTPWPQGGIMASGYCHLPQPI
ncbi:cytokine receptor common subunit beta [Symphorus nematophorus]